ncbi:MAG TPA: sigma-70 family RNA polymerase sigma factor [Candidatus Acidoferrum sp.]|nr:sigma-70 family RNA polymerase sigma factor [Candidatus Acidoferrum sp.]
MKPKLTPGSELTLGRPGNFLRPGREIREKEEHAPRTGREAVAGETRIAATDRDDLLLRRAAKGDEEAFALLYRRHQGGLYRFALRMTGSTWGAEEIVQDVFMTLIRAPKKYDPERGTVGALLFGIARNRVLKHLERTPREVPLEEKNEDGTGAGIVLQDSFTPAMWAEKRERMHQVRAAVLDLPTEFREAVVMCELEEMSYEEAAQMTGCPIGTIRSRLHRGRALLLAKLEMLRDVPRRLKAAR